MKLEIKKIWSPDLIDENQPDDVNNFSVLIQVSIGEKDDIDGEVFSLEVCSPSLIKEKSSGMFIQNTLVLDKFDWEVIKTRIEKLLRHAESSKSWNEVILRLAGFLSYSDGDLWDL